MTSIVPHSYKISRDVYFTDIPNSAFLQFYFQGLQDFGELSLQHSVEDPCGKSKANLMVPCFHTKAVQTQKMARGNIW